MSGEYYYGGIGVLTLFAIFAIVGSLPSGTVPLTGSVSAQPVGWRLAQ